MSDSSPALPFAPFLGSALDTEELAARAQARHEAAKLSCSRDGRFIASSLLAWLQHAQDAGVPHVPAARVLDVPRLAILGCEQMSAEQMMLWSSLSKEEADACLAGDMLRWDHCSSLDLKQAMAEGRQALPLERTVLEPSDPRAWDLAYEFPGDTIAVCRRPWVRPVMVDGFPLEFRVFLKDSKVYGVASYYPQRPLPATGDVLSAAAMCERLANRLAAHLLAKGASPWMPNMDGSPFAEGQVSATIDFLVSEAGEVLMLEAGPPFGAGAHPCAFLDRPISGVALELAPGVTLR